MKLLKDILYRARILDVVGSTNKAIEGISMDSRSVKPLHAFVAVKGVTVDGHNFIDKAIQSGASAIICETLPSEIHENVSYVKVGNSAEALGYIASNFYDNPSEKLEIIAVTGTNGKTTTATLLYTIAQKLGKKAGLISTVVNKIHDHALPSTHTTPDAISIQKLFAEMVKAGCTHCFIEASSHALHQHRLTGTNIKGGLFTNITHDHLDYHGTFNEYIKAKKILFDILPSNGFALINNDDRHAEFMLQNCKAKHKSYALQSMATYRAKVLENSFSGLHLSIDSQELYTRLIGGFNAYNVLVVYATCVELGFDKLEVLTALSTVEAPQGRFQYFTSQDNKTVIVDYAHTPDALQNVLDTIKDIRSGNENVITLVGCGGDRDKTKRPVMAKIAAECSERTLLTSDNPRSEEPEAIINDMKAGLDPILMRKTLMIVDRREAIRTACSLANPGDIILIAGKGHEKYQEINGVKHPFDDYQIALETLTSLSI
ncbi:MAG: UDP-N-acetylmuramoyl-L-alanyl-D-glutamate--2,6-diaminopimelate ligase [Flavobacteriales bacterium]